jgi:hypothetical protein
MNCLYSFLKVFDNLNALKNLCLMEAILRFFTLLFFGSLLMSCGDKKKEDRLNVLLIITDDQGWGDLSFHGNQIVETPNLDSLASKSL